MANQHDYINYNNIDLLASHKRKKSSDFIEKEYRFKIKADIKNHIKMNAYFREIEKLIKNMQVLNVEYYKWEKEKEKEKEGK